MLRNFVVVSSELSSGVGKADEPVSSQGQNSCCGANVQCTCIISTYQTSEYPFSRALIGYSSSGYPVLVYTKPVNSVFRAL